MRLYAAGETENCSVIICATDLQYISLSASSACCRSVSDWSRLGSRSVFASTGSGRIDGYVAMFSFDFITLGAADSEIFGVFDCGDAVDSDVAALRQ